jgi:hypothetical protein
VRAHFVVEHAITQRLRRIDLGRRRRQPHLKTPTRSGTGVN